MRYAITFWTQPDWQKESSVNPNFLIGAGAVAVLLIALGILGSLMAELESTRTELSRTEHKLEQSKGDVEEIRRQRACTRFWREALNTMNGIHRNRILWSRQLETLAFSVPESMTLAVLSVRALDDLVPTDNPDDTVRWYGTRYEVRFQGRVEDERASAIIRRFSQELPTVPGFRGLVEGVELSSESPLRQEVGPGKEFVLTSTYRLIDWREGKEQ